MPTLTTDWKTYDLPTDMAVVDVNSQIAAYDPSQAPLLALLTRINKRDAHNTTVEWFEDELVGRYAELSATTAATTGQETIDMESSGAAQLLDPGGSAGVIARVLPSGEQILVTSVSGAQIICTRDFSDTTGAAGTLATGTVIVKIATVDNENAVSHTPLITVPTLKTNIMALTKDPVTFSNSELATKKWTGDDRRYELNKLGIEHAVNLERALLLGKKKTGAASTPRMCDGVDSFISTNIKSTTTALTESDMEDFVTQVAEQTRGIADEWWLFASANLVQAINEFGRDKIRRVNAADSPYGIAFTEYMTANGAVHIVRHWLLEGSGTTTADNTLRQAGYLLNLRNIVYRPLRGRDTKLHMNIQENDRDGEKHEYRTEFSLEVHLEKTHGKISGSAAFT